MFKGQDKLMSPIRECIFKVWSRSCLTAKLLFKVLEITCYFIILLLFCWVTICAVLAASKQVPIEKSFHLFMSSFETVYLATSSVQIYKTCLTQWSLKCQKCSGSKSNKIGNNWCCWFSTYRKIIKVRTIFKIRNKIKF